MTIKQPHHPAASKPNDDSCASSEGFKIDLNLCHVSSACDLKLAGDEEISMQELRQPAVHASQAPQIARALALVLACVQ